MTGHPHVPLWGADGSERPRIRGGENGLRGAAGTARSAARPRAGRAARSARLRTAWDVGPGECASRGKDMNLEGAECYGWSCVPPKSLCQNPHPRTLECDYLEVRSSQRSRVGTRSSQTSVVGTRSSQRSPVGMRSRLGRSSTMAVLRREFGPGLAHREEAMTRRRQRLE